jgi:malonyl CoA-acyl carrier protein transacylase
MAEMKEGGMAAVKGLSIKEIHNVIESYGLEGLDIANYNTPNQVVLSGPRQLIERSRSLFEAAGATLYFQLNVSGAFHSRCMQPAREEFERFLEPFHFTPLQIPVVSNVEARFYESGKVKTLLARQLVQPVRWTDSIAFLLKNGDVSFKEVGPGDVLTKLIKSIQANAIEVQTVFR